MNRFILEKKANRIARELIPYAAATLTGPTPNLDEPACRAEALFECYLKARGWKGRHTGWPDYFTWHPASKRWRMIEVKGPGDHLHKAQRKMFDAMEEGGIQVFIWTPEFPDRLFPWRAFETRRREMRRPVSARAR